MNIYADKTLENKNQSFAKEDFQKQDKRGSSFKFIDNRPEAIAQRKLMERANQSQRTIQLNATQVMANNHSAKQFQPIQKKANNKGLPDSLKSGIENLSGLSMDDVKVHYNSVKPAELNAHAYAQGTDIHLAKGQEKHLPHEAWHVVQQKQGRVKPTKHLKSKVPINDDEQLEREADLIGKRFQLKDTGLKNCNNKMEVNSNFNNNSDLLANNLMNKFPEFSNILQLMRGNRVERNNKMPWFWGETLEATWGDYNIPIHACHTTGLNKNGLAGGYTIIGKNGNYIPSKVYTIKSPKSGANKEGHVEHQLISQLEAALLHDMADDSKVGDDALVVLEIHQWFTPCSGKIGCTQYLMDKINEYNNIYNEVSAGGRFSAVNLYSSGLSESHYKSKDKDRTMEVTNISDDDDYEFETKQPGILHQDTKRWG